MANPGYPQMGQMPQMPQMGGPPMGAQQMHMQQRPMRRGTSKAVPVVVSAGLAVGVFCGLLFGVGTGKTEAAAGPAKGNNIGKSSTKPDEEPAAKTEPGAAPKGLGATAPVAVKPGAGSAAPVAPVVAAPVEPAKIKLTVQIKPDAAAKEAKITVDGTEAEGLVAEIPADTKSVKVEVKSNGFRTAEKKIDLLGGDVTLEIEMTKKSGGGGGGVRPPKRPDKPPGGNTGGNSSGGLIDI